METDNAEYIKFDVEKLRELDNVYRNAANELAEHFDFNLKSVKKLREYLCKITKTDVPDTKIKTLIILAQDLPEGSLEKDLVEIIVAYKRLQYSIKNYTTYILNNNLDGKIYLIDYNGNLLMKSKQPLSYNQELLACIASITPKALETIERGQKF